MATINLSVLGGLLADALVDLEVDDTLEIGVMTGTEPDKSFKAAMKLRLTAAHITALTAAPRDGGDTQAADQAKTRSRKPKKAR